ncbi:MAG: MBL fold metallo-hydrolase [Chloroflexi bacterium]|nr:MBL fold metallo-hydrolase [Chloroflexota bacterium]
MQTLTFGSITVDAVSDGELFLPFARMFPGADAAAFARHGGIKGEAISAPLTTFLVRAAGRTILVDTGIGADLGSLGRFGFGGTCGLLPAALTAAAIDPATVDTVVSTHLHSDHIGWNVTVGDEPRPLFPNARYVVSRTEWAFWSATSDSTVARCVRPLERSGHLELVPDDHVVAPGISLLPTPGHTPGHVSVLVLDGGEGGVITGDAAHHPAEMENPDLSPPFDSDPVLSAASRRALVERVEAEGLVVIGGHFPEPTAGRVVRVGKQRTWHWLGA